MPRHREGFRGDRRPGRHRDLRGTTPPPPTTGSNLLGNPGFESGNTGWTGTAGPITNNTGRPARAGSWKAWLGTNATYTQKSFNLTADKGRTVTIRFTMTEDSSLQTSFVVDGTSVATS